MIKANFKAYSSYQTDSLHQWDINQKLEVTGLNLLHAPEVHFSNSNLDRAIVRQSSLMNGVVTVSIPNALLQEPFRIFAHIGVYEGDTFKVIELVEIPVIPRKRPADYQLTDTDEEVYSFKRLENLLANRATTAQVANIIAHNNDTNGNSELVDIRTGADNTVYASAGEAVRAIAHKMTSCFTPLDQPVLVDEVNHTITIPKGFYTYPKGILGVRSVVVDIVLTYVVDSVLRYVKFDLTSSTAEFVERNYVFKTGEVCLLTIYKGGVHPVELAEKRLARTTRAGLSDSGHTFMQDFFAPMMKGTGATFKIVLGGDSITHGVGGSGFAQNGDTIIGATSKSAEFKRNPNGYCWANLFKDYIETNYNATVVNNGCTGTHSAWWDEFKALVIPADADLFILTVGTNDRNNTTYTGTTRAEQLANYYAHTKSIVEYCHENGTKVLLCSCLPATAANEEQDVHLASVFEFNGVLQRVASEFDMDYFNLYNAIFFKVMDKGEELSNYLPDGLHPNDEMHRMMFYEYIKGFGLAPSYEIVD